MNAIYKMIDALLPFEWLNPLFMKNAFIAILIACPMFGALGSVVVSNRMAFFSDAIGHSALTGVALGTLFSIDPLAAMTAFSALLSIAIIAVKRRGGEASDTVIGVFSSVAVALGIALLSARGSIARYQSYIVGDILSIRPADIVRLAIAACVMAVVWTFVYNKMLLTNVSRDVAHSRGVHTLFVEQLFSLVIAVLVTLSIRWTGLLVINSLLVLPAASARMVSRNSLQYMAFSVAISLVSGIAGLLLSYYAGASSGASIVLVNAALFAVCLVLRRRV